jgi:DNA-binding response OmpR family regulator
MAKILYLEDEVWQVQGTLINFLEKELGHRVSVVKSIAEATGALSSAPYDVVFLDIMLDFQKGSIEFDDSGLLIVQHILDGKFAEAGNPSTLPLIIASGIWDATVRDSSGRKWTVEDRASALGIKYDHFLRKPFLVDEVRNILERVLRRSDEIVIEPISDHQTELAKQFSDFLANFQKYIKVIKSKTISDADLSRTQLLSMLTEQMLPVLRADLAFVGVRNKNNSEDSLQVIQETITTEIKECRNCDLIRRMNEAGWRFPFDEFILFIDNSPAAFFGEKLKKLPEAFKGVVTALMVSKVDLFGKEYLLCFCDVKEKTSISPRYSEFDKSILLIATGFLEVGFQSGAHRAKRESQKLLSGVAHKLEIPSSTTNFQVEIPADMTALRKEVGASKTEVLINAETSSPKMSRNQVFISYSHKDHDWLEKLRIHLEPLRRNRKISIWSDAQIEAGTNWCEEIQKALNSAKVAVLLVSPNFLASNFIAENELPQLLKMAEEDGLVIYCVAISASLYKETKIEKYQFANAPGRPLDTMTNAKQNTELVRICELIKNAVSS